jgi:hypothetical protein
MNNVCGETTCVFNGNSQCQFLIHPETALANLPQQDDRNVELAVVTMMCSSKVLSLYVSALALKYTT